MAMIFFSVGWLTCYFLESNHPPPQAQDNMTEVAEDLCLDWLGAQSPEAMTAAVVMAVDRADALDKQPVDIYNELVVVCPGFAQGAGNLPPEVWD